MGVGDGAAGINGGRLAGVACRHGTFSDGIFYLLATTVLGQVLPGISPVVAVLRDRGIRNGDSRGHVVESESEGSRPLAVLVAGVVPGFRHRDVSNFRRMAVRDDAIVRGRSRLTGIAFGYVVLSDSICELIAIRIIAGNGFPGVGPGIAVFALHDLRLGSCGPGGQPIEGQLQLLGADAVLIAVVVPDLVHVDIDKLILVGKGYDIQRVGRFDLTGCRRTSHRKCISRTFTFSDLYRCTFENKTGGKGPFSDGIGRAGGQVIQSDTVSGLDIQDDVIPAFAIVPSAAGRFGAGLHRIGDRIAARAAFYDLSIANRDPDPVIGIVARIILRL